MSIWLILAVTFAGLEALAVGRDLRPLEFIAKPAVILSLMIWLYAETGLQGNALWFELGLLFSLLGDVLLLFIHPRMFISGLAAFLLTHIFYQIGFQDQLLHPDAWSFFLLFFILWNGVRLLRRIVGAVRAREENRGEHLSQPGVTLARLVGQNLGPFDRVVTSTAQRAIETAIAMGFAVDEFNETMSSYGSDVEHEAPWPLSITGYAEVAPQWWRRCTLGKSIGAGVYQTC